MSFKKMYILLRSEILKLKLPVIVNLATNPNLNAKKNKVKEERPSITDLATTTALNTKINVITNKIPNITNLATTSALNAVKRNI